MYPSRGPNGRGWRPRARYGTDGTGGRQAGDRGGRTVGTEVLAASGMDRAAPPPRAGCAYGREKQEKQREREVREGVKRREESERRRREGVKSLVE